MSGHGGSWQLCPVCTGRGRVPQGFYNTSMSFSGTSTYDEMCRTCRYRGIIQAPVCTEAAPCDHCKQAQIRAAQAAQIGTG